MSELVLYVLATGVVLAGVAYFFVKQREQEALAANANRGRANRQQKTKKEAKPKKEPKEPKEPRQRKQREEAAPAVPLTKRQKAAAAKEEDETKGVLDFLKGKKFSSEQTEKSAQAKVRSAPPAPVVTQRAPAPVVVDDYSDSDSDSEGYETIKGKPKSTKDKEDTPAKTQSENQPKKHKFFTKGEKEEYEARKKAEYQAEKEARKNRKERKPRKQSAEGNAEDGDFVAPKERRPRKERAPRAEGDEGSDAEGERKSRHPPKEPDLPPVFPSEYETKDMDNILDSLTSYYASNPQAGRAKKSKQPAQPAETAENGKVEDEQ